MLNSKLSRAIVLQLVALMGLDAVKVLLSSELLPPSDGYGLFFTTNVFWCVYQCIYIYWINCVTIYLITQLQNFEQTVLYFCIITVFDHAILQTYNSSLKLAKKNREAGVLLSSSVVYASEKVHISRYIMPPEIYFEWTSPHSLDDVMCRGSGIFFTQKTSRFLALCGFLRSTFSIFSMVCAELADFGI